jgi:pyruvate dehydrogenase kinase 2/3/4
MLPPHHPNDDQYVGMIYKHTSPYDIVQRAIHDATRLCINRYGAAPAVEISGRLDLTFCYIPTHLHYILLELLKNAMRATMEFHTDFRHPKPPVTVIIADGMDNEDVIIKVMDEGGGIPRSQMDHIWSYLFTTADPNIQQQFLYNPNNSNNDNKHASSPILAGLGYGLPLSRAYARYFGGDLDIISMEGYGTDAFCHLARLGDKAPSLPV